MKPILLSLFVALLMVGCGGDIEVPKMIACDGCGKKVSSKGDDCPNCGHPIADSVVAYKEEKMAKRNEEAQLMERMDKATKALEALNEKNRRLVTVTTVYYDNGQKRGEQNWKDGKLMSVVVWKPNGEKCPVTNAKDGNGVAVFYRANGTEDFRVTYKDGKPVFD